MGEEVRFECQSCKRSVIVQVNENKPTCCGRQMKQVTKEICLQPAHSEHARPMEDEDACDDFRAG